MPLRRLQLPQRVRAADSERRGSATPSGGACSARRSMNKLRALSRNAFSSIPGVCRRTQAEGQRLPGSLQVPDAAIAAEGETDRQRPAEQRQLDAIGDSQWLRLTASAPLVELPADPLAVLAGSATRPRAVWRAAARRRAGRDDRWSARWSAVSPDATHRRRCARRVRWCAWFRQPSAAVRRQRLRQARHRQRPGRDGATGGASRSRSRPRPGY
jgi:hypothetical protein